MIIDGKWFDKGSAADVDAALHIDNHGYKLQTEAGVIKQGNLDDVDISDRLGNVQRKLTFEDGSVFATSDNDAVDQSFKSVLSSNRFLHVIESNLSFVVFALILTIAVSFSFFKWGVPAISSVVAHALPQKTNDIIGAHTLKFLDKLIFEETKLNQQRQAEITQHFKEKLIPIAQAKEKEPLKFTLHFRAWNEDEKGIPNAFALPSGDIILTDKFVELSQSQNEIDAVILHEMGHVAHRHSLKLVVQSTLVTTIVMIATGDVNAVADLGLGLGSVLLSSNYSRTYEAEADQYAFDQMLLNDMDPISFATIMRRMTSYSESLHAEKEKSKDDDSVISKSSDKEENSELLDYFSTHPATEERIQQAERYSKCFADGLKVCDAIN